MQEKTEGFSASPYKFKAGDHVRHVWDEEDEGLFLKYINDEMAEVQWKDDGLCQNAIKNLYPDSHGECIKEQEAVMLLLSLGYTVSKGNV